ncbi:MAG: hypothetical protein RL100_594 [Actinomycetota bacterium]|jgi:hypothetical protein
MSQRVANELNLHSERVLPSFASFLPATLLIPAAWLTLSPLDPNLGWLIGAILAIVVWALQCAAAPKIELTKTHLTVGNASIERKYLGKARAINKSEAFRELGPELNARAFIKLQPSVRTLVRVEITDATDPTPYWIFSTRAAEVLLKLLKK